MATPTAGAGDQQSSAPSEEQLSSLYEEFAQLAGPANGGALKAFYEAILSHQPAAAQGPKSRPAPPDAIFLDVAGADKVTPGLSDGADCELGTVAAP